MNKRKVKRQFKAVVAASKVLDHMIIYVSTEEEKDYFYEKLGECGINNVEIILPCTDMRSASIRKE